MTKQWTGTRKGRPGTLGAITQRVKPVTERADDRGARSGTRGKARTMVDEDPDVLNERAEIR